MLNMVIPMAGLEVAADASYKDPKPLIPVHGIPMIKVVADNLSPAGRTDLYSCVKKCI